MVEVTRYWYLINIIPLIIGWCCVLGFLVWQAARFGEWWCGRYPVIMRRKKRLDNKIQKLSAKREKLDDT